MGATVPQFAWRSSDGEGTLLGMGRGWEERTKGGGKGWRGDMGLGLAHLLCPNLDVVVGGGDNDVLRGEVSDVHSKLVGISEGLDVAGSCGAGCGEGSCEPGCLYPSRGGIWLLSPATASSSQSQPFPCTLMTSAYGSPSPTVPTLPVPWCQQTWLQLPGLGGDTLGPTCVHDHICCSGHRWLQAMWHLFLAVASMVPWLMPWTGCPQPL